MNPDAPADGSADAQRTHGYPLADDAPADTSNVPASDGSSTAADRDAPRTEGRDDPRADPPLTRRNVAIAGHVGDLDTVRAALGDRDPTVRATALGALARLGGVDEAVVRRALHDTDPGVRRRAATIAAGRPGVALLDALRDPDPLVAETAAWALGERIEVGDVDDEHLDALLDVAASADDPLVREAAVAALGAIGDRRGLNRVLAATADKPAVRRRAVIALAAFCDPDDPRADEVRAAITAALSDRDWQVRQAAEDLMAILDEASDDPRERADNPDDIAPADDATT